MKLANTKFYKQGKFTLASTDVLQFAYDDFKDWWNDFHNIDDSYEAFRNWYVEEYGEDEPIPVDGSDEYNQWASELYPEEYSNEFWDWAYDERNENWDNDISNIKDCKEYQKPVVVCGHAGLWWGRPEYMPRKFNSLNEAIDEIFKTAFDDIDIEYDDGKICVYGHHHDGTNYYEIHFLSKKGLAKYERAENRWEDVKELKSWDIKRIPYLYAM